MINLIPNEDKKYRFCLKFYLNIVRTYSGATEAKSNCSQAMNVTKNVRHQLHLHCAVAMFSFSVISQLHISINW